MKTMLFLTLLGAFACSQTIPSQKKDLIVVTTCDTTVTIRPKETFTIQLPAQIGTGFSWGIGAQTDPSLLLTTSEEVFSDTGANDSDGRAETQILKLTATTKKGTNVLTLHYRQSFAKNAAPDKTCMVTVVVK